MTRVFRFSSSFFISLSNGIQIFATQEAIGIMHLSSWFSSNRHKTYITAPYYNTTYNNVETNDKEIYKYNNTTYNIETKEPIILQRHLQKRQRQTSNRNNQVQRATTQPHYHITPTRPTQTKTTQRHGKTTRQRHHKTLTNHQDARSPPPHHHPTILPPLITLLQWIP